MNAEGEGVGECCGEGGSWVGPNAGYPAYIIAIRKNPSEEGFCPAIRASGCEARCVGVSVPRVSRTVRSR